MFIPYGIKPEWINWRPGASGGDGAAVSLRFWWFTEPLTFGFARKVGKDLDDGLAVLVGPVVARRS